MQYKPYWLPNLFTSLTLISGFYAITLALEGELDMAVRAIMCAMLFDFLDGWIARKTNTTSPFGREYDSLCDMVAFGISPALTAYQILSWDSVFSWLIPAVYSCAVAMRLARFNVKESSVGAFEGLPCTAGGPLVVLMCYFLNSYVPQSPACMVLAFTVLSVAFLMNTNIKYRSFKQNHRYLTRRRGIFAVAALISIGALMSPLVTLMLLLLAYVISPILGIKQQINQWRGRVVQHH